MRKVDMYLKEVLDKVMNEGYVSPPSRAVYIDENGVEVPATTKYIINHNEVYDIGAGEFPVTSTRPIYWQKAFGELLWMLVDKSNVVRYTLLGEEDTNSNQSIAEAKAKMCNLQVSLEGKYNVGWWREWTYQKPLPEYGLVAHHIGNTYGAIVRETNSFEKLVNSFKENKYSRRAIHTFWQLEELGYLYNDFSKGKEAKLPPCFYQFILETRNTSEGEKLDMILTARSSDYLMAGNQDRIQYTMLLLVLATHFGMKPGNLHVQYINLHIYNGQFGVVEEFKKRLEQLSHEDEQEPFFGYTGDGDLNNIKMEDFFVGGYQPIKPQIKMPLAI